MNDLINEANSVFSKKLNALIVDDDKAQLFVHKEMLGSPLFNIRTCNSLQDAQQCVSDASFAWHCWVLDINLGSDKSGLELLDSSPNYPFVMVLSGLRSVKIGSDAIKRGAMSVFDKGSLEIDGLYREICKIAALGYLLDGKGTQYLPTFSILKDYGIIDIDAWAEKACITTRQLQRICSLHSSLTPKNAIMIYNAIYYLLIQGMSFSDQQDNNTACEDVDKNFYLSCIDAMIKVTSHKS